MTEGRDLFSAWSSLNQVMADWRSRFDVLREIFPNIKTKVEARKLLAQEGYDERYPLLPDWLPEGEDVPEEEPVLTTEQKLMEVFRFQGCTDGQARERAKEIIAEIAGPIYLQIEELKKSWVDCHRQCGVEFHKAHCRFPGDADKKQKCAMCQEGEALGSGLCEGCAERLSHTHDPKKCDRCKREKAESSWRQEA